MCIEFEQADWEHNIPVAMATCGSIFENPLYNNVFLKFRAQVVGKTERLSGALLEILTSIEFFEVLGFPKLVIKNPSLS